MFYSSKISRSEMIHCSNSSAIDWGRRPKASCNFAVSWIIRYYRVPLTLSSQRICGEACLVTEAAIPLVGGAPAVTFGSSEAVAGMQVCCAASRCAARRRG
eukprot:7286226-Prymnesium_polylepis.1